MAYEKLNLQTGQEWSDDAAAHFEDGIHRAHQMVEDLPEPTAPKWSEITGKPTIPAATPAGTRAQLDAGTDTTVRAFSAKDISEFVAAKIIAAQPAPDAEG